MSVWHVSFMLVVAMAARVSEDLGTVAPAPQAPAPKAPPAPAPKAPPAPAPEAAAGDGAPKGALHEERPREPLTRCQGLAFKKAQESPWLKLGKMTHGRVTYNVQWERALDDTCEGMTGVPSVLSFTVGNGTTEGGTNFKAVLKGENVQGLPYVPEVELTKYASLTNGLCPGVIQGAHMKQPPRMYLMTELLDGKDMGQAVLQPSVPALDDQIAKLIVAQLIYILRMLAQQKIIHKDIKPSNLMLAPLECHEVLQRTGDERSKGWAQQGCKIVLIDYGFACTYDKDVVNTYRRDLACKWERAGSVQTVAPEVFETGWPTETSDVFSMGVTIFYILTGGKYPGVRGRRELMRDQRNHTILSDLGEAVTSSENGITAKSLMDTLQKMLLRRPGARPPPDELWNDAWLNGPDNTYRMMAEARSREALEDREGKAQFKLPLYPEGRSEDFPGAPQGEGIPSEWLSAVDVFTKANDRLMNPTTCLEGCFGAIRKMTVKPTPAKK